MSFDANKYLKYLDDCDLTNEQKLERIQKVRVILNSFVDTAFGTHPVQLCRKDSSEKDLQSTNEAVESKSLSKHFRNTSAPRLKRNEPLSRAKKESLHHAEPH